MNSFMPDGSIRNFHQYAEFFAKGARFFLLFFVFTFLLCVIIFIQAYFSVPYSQETADCILSFLFG